MIHATAFGRLGKDAEVRFLADGTAVAQLNIGCSHSRKGKDGTKPTTWVTASLWGKQAEALAPYLLKGTQVVAVLEDLHNREYQSNKGSGVSLEGRVISITLGAKSEASEPARSAPKPQSKPPQSGTSFDDMDDLIPF